MSSTNSNPVESLIESVELTGDTFVQFHFRDGTREEKEFIHYYSIQHQYADRRLENSPLDKILCQS